MIAVLIGLCSGIISGMGIGGGTILIPALVLFLNLEQHAAQGVNLIYFIPTAIVALWVHIKNRSVNFRVALSIIISGVIGAVGGSLLADIISAGLLRKLFGIFLFAMGIYEFFKKDKKLKKVQEK